MKYPVITIKFKYISPYALWHFEILGRICKIFGHKVKDKHNHAYPGYIFCSRCARQFRGEEEKWRSV